MGRRSAYCHRDGVGTTDPDGAYLFTGTSTGGTSPSVNFNVPHGIGTGEMTVRFWIKPFNQPTGLNPGVFGLTHASGYGDVSTHVGASPFLPFFWYPTSPAPRANTTIPNNAWIHVVYTRSAAGLHKIYFDSVDVTDANGSTVSSYNLTNKPFTIGNRQNFNTTIKPGLITEVLVLSTEWDLSEVQQDYGLRRLGNDGTVTGTVVGYFPLDGKTADNQFGSGSTLIAASDFGLRDTHATVAGASDGTTDATGLLFDSASYANWTSTIPNTTDNTPDMYFVWVHSGTGVTAGRYQVASRTADKITLATSPGANGSNIVFTVARGLATWGHPIWQDDNPFPPPTADAGGPYTACADTPTQLNGTATNGVYYLWTTSGDGSWEDETSLTPIYTPGAADVIAETVTLTLTVTGYADQTAEDTAEMTINVGPSVSAGGPYTTTGDTPVQVTATSTKYNELAWTTDGDGEFDDATSPQPYYTPGEDDIATGFVTITVTVDDECGSADADAVILIAPDSGSNTDFTISNIELRTSKARPTPVLVNYGGFGTVLSGVLHSFGTLNLSSDAETPIPPASVGEFGWFIGMNLSRTQTIKISVDGTTYPVKVSPRTPFIFELARIAGRASLLRATVIQPEDDVVTAGFRFMILSV